METDLASKIGAVHFRDNSQMCQPISVTPESTIYPLQYECGHIYSSSNFGRSIDWVRDVALRIRKPRIKELAMARNKGDGVHTVPSSPPVGGVKSPDTLKWLEANEEKNSNDRTRNHNGPVSLDVRIKEMVLFTHWIQPAFVQSPFAGTAAEWAGKRGCWRSPAEGPVPRLCAKYAEGRRWWENGQPTVCQTHGHARCLFKYFWLQWYGRPTFCPDAAIFWNEELNSR